MFRRVTFRALSSSKCAWTHSACGASKASSGPSRLGIAVFGGLSACCAGLGVWQLQRRERKLTLIEERLHRLQQEPVELSAVLQEGATSEELQYSVVKVEGEWLYNSQMLLGLRGAPQSVSKGASGVGGGGGLGYYIITPVRTADGSIVLVNRGWTRRDDVDAALKRREQKNTVLGVLRSGTESSRFVNATGPTEGNIWLFLNVEDMVKHHELHSTRDPLLIDAISIHDDDDDQTSPIVRRSGDDYIEFPTTPFKHSVYAFTWFSFAAIGLVTAAVRFRGVKPPARILPSRRKQK